MSAVGCNNRRRSCDECRGSRGTSFLIYFKDNLGAHAWPDHDINLQEGEKTGNAAIMSNVVPIDHIAFSRDQIPDMGG